MHAAEIVVAAAFGLIFGSFANVAIYRLPRGLSLVKPGSFCPVCRKQIKPYDNIPLISYLLLGGRCRNCGSRISPRYPAIELATALLFAGCAALVRPGAAVPAGCLLLLVLLIAALIDFQTYRIPNEIQVAGAVGGLALLALASGLVGNWNRFLIALICGAGAFLAFFIVALLAPRGGLGFGDVKLVGVTSLYLGWLAWQLVPWSIALGIALGAVYALALVAAGKKRLKDRVALGPFLAAGAAVFLLASHALFSFWVNKPPALF